MGGHSHSPASLPTSLSSGCMYEEENKRAFKNIERNGRLKEKEQRTWRKSANSRTRQTGN